MKGVNIPQPAGLPALLDRVGQIKARFRGATHSFPQSLAVARAAQPPTDEVQQAIARAAERNGIEPELLRALAQVESGFRVDGSEEWQLRERQGLFMQLVWDRAIPNCSR